MVVDEAVMRFPAPFAHPLSCGFSVLTSADDSGRSSLSGTFAEAIVSSVRPVIHRGMSTEYQTRNGP